MLCYKITLCQEKHNIDLSIIIWVAWSERLTPNFFGWVGVNLIAFKLLN